MAKNKQTEVEASDVIDQKYLAVLSDYSDKEKEAFLKLSEEEKEEEVAGLLALQASAVALTDIEMTETKPEQESIKIYSAGGPGLRAGSKIKAYLMGTHHVFAKEFKENWKEFVAQDGTVFFTNDYLQFKGLDGKVFGVWGGATLRSLEVVPTLSSATGQIDPLVEISYIGKIEGRERLAKEFGIKLTQGNSCHIFTTKVDARVKYDKYTKGCTNSLNRPFPIQNNGPVITRDEATRINYEKIMNAQNNSNVVLIS